MKLRHQYNSASAYELCGYERIPAYPCVGERVIILCRTEPYVPNAELKLIWTANKSPQPEVTGYLRYIDEEKRGYYEFCLPPLADSVINYKIEAMLNEKVMNSECFILNPLRRAVIPQLKGAWQVGKSIYFKLRAEEKEFIWALNVDRGNLHSCLEPAGMPFPEVYELPDNCRLELLPNIFAEIRLAPFSFKLVGPEHELLRLNTGDLSFQLDHTGALFELHVQLLIAANGIYGFGERFNAVNQMGKQVIISSEEKFTDQGERSYLPIPFFFTDRGIGMLHEAGYESRYTINPCKYQDGYSVIDISFSCNGECKDTVFFGKPSRQIKQYISHTSGAAVLPPPWAFGPWASSNRWETQRQVEEQLDALQKYSIPTSVIVLERWSDDTTFDRFEDTPHPLVKSGGILNMEDFRFEENPRWPNPAGLVNRIHDLGIKVILWQAPIVRVPPNATEQCRHDYQYAILHRYCVMQPDGSPFLCPEGWFAGSLLIDFTNPEAVQWWMKKREWLVTQLHVDGFKTDSGELVTDNRSVFANGKTGREMRNLYPMAYEKAYADMMQRHRPDSVNFTRAGYTGAQKYPIHWTGDQCSTFAELRAQVCASLSAGLSGVLFVGTDLAGFAGEMPTSELYYRGVSLSAFSGLMQFHSEPTDGCNNDRSPWNMVRLRKNPNLLEHYRRYANIRMCLLPYLYNEAIYCVEAGRPLMAHLILDYPEDCQAKYQEDSYFLGRSLLVAPILESGAKGRQVYFPAGKWIELATGRIYHEGGEYISSHVNEIPVFLKWGSILPVSLSSQLSFGGNEQVSHGDQLCFLCAGYGSTEFNITPNHKITIAIAKDSIFIIGDCPELIVLFTLTGEEPPDNVLVNGSARHFEPVTGFCWGHSISGVKVTPLFSQGNSR